MNIKDLFSFKNKKNWKVVLVEDVPAEVINNRIYLVGEQNIWLIVFRCPCGCAETIQLNTLDTDDPFWSYRIRNKKISIYPSVKRIRGCRSHFFIRNSKVIYAKWRF